MSDGTANASDELELAQSEAAIEVDSSKSAPEDRETAGPFDIVEVPTMRPYVDFGGIKVAPREGLQLRLEVDERAKRVVAVTLDFEGSLLQVQAKWGVGSLAVGAKRRSFSFQNRRCSMVSMSNSSSSWGCRLCAKAEMCW